MSWQAYVDERLVATGNLNHAAIFSADGKSVWAASSGFQVSPTEAREIVTAFADKSEIKTVQANGLHIAGEKYIVLKADDRSIYGKKGKEGIVIVKTNKCILVSHYPETVQPGVAANTVEQLADYLIGVGF